MNFGRDFFPTPPEVIEQMLGGEPLQGKMILEPSAGAGHLVQQLVQRGAKNVLVCEQDDQLAKILKTLSCNFLTIDFLTVTATEVSHVDYIVMNPPFSKGVDHVLHAYYIAPPGCKIIALCNAETVKNPYSRSRGELRELLDTYGQWTNLGDCFNQAERKTDVEVALLRLQKPGGSIDSEFEGFLLEDTEETQANGIMSYNLIRDVVNRYVASIKIFDEQLETAVRLNDLREGYFDGGKADLSISVTRGAVPLQRNEFKKEMQKCGWQFIFGKLNMAKYTTRGLLADLNKFVETQEQVPFTMHNVYKMLEIVVGTQGVRMDQALLEVFDKVTKHTHENRYNLEGWQTNSHYILNKRFIVPNVVTGGWSSGMRSNYSSWGEPVEDLQKALCHLTGKNYDEHVTLNNFLNADTDFGSWYDWGFFKIKGHKKGTLHLEFLDEQVWGKFNRRIAQLKGYPLPENVKETKWQKQRNKSRKEATMV